jgi:hypothetical protein
MPVKRPEWKCPRHTRYFGRLYDATPKWLSPEQKKEYYRIYSEAKRQNAVGKHRYEVDHIVPLLNPIVCGLNVPWNLRIIRKEVNQRKSNHYWPDMPGEIIEMFPHLDKENVEVIQLKLNF